jgi:hypothetical protein
LQRLRIRTTAAKATLPQPPGGPVDVGERNVARIRMQSVAGSAAEFARSNPNVTPPPPPEVFTER